VKKFAIVIFFILPFSINAADLYDYSDLSEDWKRSVREAAPVIEKEYGAFIEGLAWDNQLSASMIKAMLVAESLGDPKAISHHDAKGCMQLKDAAIADTGVKGDPFDCRTSIRMAVSYLVILRDVEGYDFPERRMVGYHDGRTGGKRIKNVLDHKYVKKVHYALRFF